MDTRYVDDSEMVNWLHKKYCISLKYYQYTWTNARLWRKNRRPGSTCDGVDLNRNFNIHWGEVSP